MNSQACRLSKNIYVITNLIIMNNWLVEMMRKIMFANYFPEFIHQVAIKFRFWKALQKKCFQSDIIFRHYVKMPSIKFWKRPKVSSNCNISWSYHAVLYILSPQVKQLSFLFCLSHHNTWQNMTLWLISIMKYFVTSVIKYQYWYQNIIRNRYTDIWILCKNVSVLWWWHGFV